jgi:predicted PurR-regulated permease PerM
MLSSSLITGIVMTITYFVFDFSLPLFLGLLTAVLALVPFLLPIFYLGIIVVCLLQAKFITAIVVGTIGVGTNLFTDNYLQPKILANKTQISFIVALLGVICGLKMLGPLGIFLGPIILNLTLQLIREFKN